jgi:hypothetical protein
MHRLCRKVWGNLATIRTTSVPTWNRICHPEDRHSTSLRTAGTIPDNMLFLFLFHWHVQNVTIPCCSQQLLPFPPVIHFYCHSSPPTILPPSLISFCHLFLGLPLGQIHTQHGVNMQNITITGTTTTRIVISNKFCSGLNWLFYFCTSYNGLAHDRNDVLPLPCDILYYCWWFICCMQLHYILFTSFICCQ